MDLPPLVVVGDRLVHAVDIVNHTTSPVKRLNLAAWDVTEE